MADGFATMTRFAQAMFGRSGLKDVIWGGLPYWQDNGRMVQGWAGNQGLRMDHMNHVHVSAFEKGGIVMQPTLGIIGEAGPEAVVPLDRFRGETQIHLHIGTMIGGSPEQVAKDLEPHLRRVLYRRSKQNRGVALG
jgi:hypothetical protein